VGASNSFLDYLENSFVDENVSLATYGTAATIDRGMTKNYQLIRQGIDAYTQKYPTGSTNIGDGITKGGTLLSSGRTFASKVMVVMTDGIRTAGPDPVPIATTLGKQGVIIYTVTFSNEADKTLMAKVAAAGSGKHFHAATGSNLQAVFENIARSIPTIITQ
jgi:Mg-chelatase subunit ChlD